ncbi:MAG: AsmA family protein [Bryobacterales bacterium]|nr:AsmA family protein [Bryobacterales bacterium]
MKRTLTTAGILAAVLGGAVLGLPLLLDANQFRGVVQSQLEAALGRKVSLGNMSIKLFPARLRVDDFAIADDPAFSASPFVKARQLDVVVALVPLLSKQVQVDSLLLEQPEVDLLQGAGKRWNFSTMGSQQPSTPSGGSTGLSLGRLELRQGRLQVNKDRYDNIDLAVRNLGPDRPFDAELAFHMKNNVDVRATLAATYQQAAATLQIASLRASVGDLALTGKGTVDMKASPANLNLSVGASQAKLTDIARLGLALGFFPADTKVGGILNANLRITGTGASLAVAGTLAATNFEVQQKGWKDPVRTPALEVTLTPQTLTTKPFTVQTGGTSLSANLSIQGYADPQPRYSATVTAKDAELEELLRVASAYGVSSANGVAGSGKASLQLTLTGPSSNLDTQGQGSLRDASVQLPSFTQPITAKTVSLQFTENGVDIKDLVGAVAGSNVRGNLKLRNFTAPRLEFDADIDKFEAAAWQKLLKEEPPAAAPSKPSNMVAQGQLRIGELRYTGLTMTQVKAALTFDRGLLRLDPITAGLFGGTEVGSIQVDMRRTPPAYALQTKLDKVDANQLLAATSPIKDMIYGALGAEAVLTMEPKPGEDLVKSMTGNMRVSLADGKLTTVNIVNQLGTVAKFAGYNAPNSFTDALGLSGTLALRDGKASTNDLKLSFAGGSMTGAGDIGLADQTLRLKVLSMLDKSTSEKAGGSKVGGYMATALANAAGELVIPALISGTFAKPVFAPDAAEFAKLKVKNIVPQIPLNDPKAAVQNVFDIFKKKK